MSRKNGNAGPSSPELELLLCCAHTSVDSAGAQRIRDLVGTQIDWPYLMRTSFAHGVMPLLHKNLSAICPNAMPESLAAQLHDWFQVHVQRNFLLTAELLKLLRLFAAHGIRALPYKGPVLAASVYGDVSLRAFWARRLRRILPAESGDEIIETGIEAQAVGVERARGTTSGSA